MGDLFSWINTSDVHPLIKAVYFIMSLILFIYFKMEMVDWKDYGKLKF